MTSRTATAPRVTGGRPATMTRSAVQQARTQGRPTTPEGGGELTADGWVNVDHHKRKHKQPGGATGLVAMASALSTSGRHRNGNTNLNGNGNGHSHNDDRPNGREMRRTQSAIDTLTTTTTSTTGDEREEPPVARPNARADALSAAVTMDKKARERSYYAHSNSNANANGMTSPPASLSLPGATWGSPPPLPPPPPGLGVGPQRGLHRSNSMSPDASAMGMQLDRGSSLQKLMSSWQLSDDSMDQSQSSVLPPPGPGGGGGGGGGGNGRTNTRNSTKSTRTGDRHVDMTLGGGGGGGGNMFQFPFSDFPPEATTTNSLRRTQSDVVPATMSLHHTTSQPSGNRQRSPSTRHPNTNANANGTNTNHANANNANTNGTNTNGSNTNSRKCGDKRDFFFRNLEFETRSLLQIDEVASFSVTDFDMARKISHAIIELFPDLKQYIEQQQQADAFFYQLSGQDPQLQPTRKYPLIVTDATACVGGNVLSFCDYFHFVYAIENDPTRVAMLENNLRVLQKTNVTCRCASYLEVMYEYHQDVIFFDPPWGGPEYKDQDKVDLYLDEQPLYEICEQLHGYAKVIVLKVPTNFDDEKFAYCVSGRVTVRKDFKKMHLVVLDFR